MIRGIKLRVNGGAFVDEIIDLGLPALNEAGYIPYLFTGAVANTDYQIEFASYNRGRQSEFGNPVVYTTPAVSAYWETIVNPHWILKFDNSIEGTTNTSEDFFAVAVPRLTEIGHFIEFLFSNGTGNSDFDALFHFRIADEADHFLFTYVNSQVNDESGFLGYYQAYAAGDTVRFTKISASRVSISVNGAGASEIVKDLTGDLTCRVETATYIGLTINAFMTNVVF